MITRQDYLNNRCSFEDYYGDVIAGLRIHFSENFLAKVREALKTDKNLNNIPLEQWDAMGFPYEGALARRFKERGDSYSLAGGVCALKTAARIAARVS